MGRQLGEDDWQALVTSIALGDCVLMLGPDAVVAEVDEGWKRLTTVFAEMLRDKLKGNYKGLDVTNYPYIAELFAREHGSNGLLAEVKHFATTPHDVDVAVLRSLASMPFKMIIDASPFQILETVMDRDPRLPYESSYYRFREGEQPLVPQPSEDSRLIYHLYGRADDLKSVVIREHDLLDFLVAVVSGNPGLPENVLSMLGMPSHSFLFLGFGLQHWYLRILLHVLASSTQNRSFALEPFGPGAEDPAFQPTRQFYSLGHNIDFFDMDFRDFVMDLRDHCEKEGAVPSGSGKAIQIGREVTAFVCHDHEDKAAAEDLTQKLKNAGVSPWIDAESIRGGQNWDHVITTVIGDVDYFIVVLTAGLLRGFKGYVYQEIAAALEQAKRYARDVSFVIPVSVDGDYDSERLAQHGLEKQHVIDLEDVGFDKLISDITRDLQRRGAVVR